METINVPIYRGRDVRRQKSLNTILGAGLVAAQRQERAAGQAAEEAQGAPPRRAVRQLLRQRV